MKKEKKPITDDDEMRPEYDLSKLKLVGRGIYAERFRRGTNLAQLIERDNRAKEGASRNRRSTSGVRLQQDADCKARTG